MVLSHYMVEGNVSLVVGRSGSREIVAVDSCTRNHCKSRKEARQKRCKKTPECGESITPCALGREEDGGWTPFLASQSI